MTDELYRKTDAEMLEPESRGVWFWDEGVKGQAAQFRCPCGERLVYVTSPPHEIEFYDNGVLASLGGSCGYYENVERKRPGNWCHFTITDGRAKMHDDAKCPGGDGSIP